MQSAKVINPKTKLSPIQKRFNQVYNEWKAEQPYKQRSLIHFSEKMGISVGSLHNMLTGKYEVNRSTIDAVVKILGYSPEWFIGGSGEKKGNVKDTKLIHEIQLLRTELQIMRQELDVMKARMKAYELKTD